MSSYGTVFASLIAATPASSVIMQNNSSSDGNGTVLPVSGFALALLHITASTPMGGGTTIRFEASVDGVDWNPILGSEVGTTNTATGTIEPGDWQINISGYGYLRARVSDYSAGVITVVGYTSVFTAGVGTGGGGGGDVNLTEIVGSAVDVGNGTAGGATIRCTLASDSTGQVKLASGANNIGSLTDITGSISLPTGAAVEAKQPNFGTAGAASPDVLSVQGVASMTPLKVDASGVSLTVTAPGLELAQDSATSGQPGPLVQGAVSTSAPSYTNAKTNPLSLTTAGALRVDASGTTVPVSASSLPLPTGAATAAKQPALGTAGTPSSDVLSIQGVASGTPLPVSFSGNQDVNVAEINGNTAATGSGASNAGTIRVITSSDSSIAQTASIVPTFTTLQNASAGNGNGTAINTSGYGTCLLSVTGSLGGGTTINFESSADNGTTWVSILGTQVGSTTTATSTTSTGDWVFSCAAQSQVRARISSYGSGTITVKGFLSVISTGGGGGGGGGGSVTSNLTQINGTTVSQGNGTAGNGCQRVSIASDNTAFSTIVSGAAKGSTSAAASTVTSVDSNHNALDVYIRGGGTGGSTTISPATTVTYMSSDTFFTPAASATDIWTMTGSSTKTIKILQLAISYTGSAAGAGTFFLLRRSSANSGGTSSSTTPGKMDVNDGASTSTIKTYTANPSSLGTTASQLACFTMTPVAQVSTAIFAYTQASTDVQIFNYSISGQPIILRGTSDILALNCNGTSPSGGTVKISVRVIFTEE